MKRLAATMLALLTLLLTLPLCLALTETGTRLLTAGVSRFSPLQLDYAGGRLLGQLRLRRLYLPLARLELELEQVAVEFNPRCLWESRFCLRTLRVGQLALAVNDAGASAAAPARAPGRRSLTLPLRLSAPHVRVARSVITWPGGEVHSGPARLNVAIEPEGIRVASARIEEARLHLHQVSETSRERVVLPALWLPFELAIERLQLIRPGWDIAARAGELERIEANLRWQGAQLEVARLALIRAQWGEAELAGQLLFEGAWPLQATARGRPAERLRWQSLRPGPLSLEVAGDLSALALDLYSSGEQAMAVTAQLDALDPALSFSAGLRLTANAPLALTDLAPVPADFPPVAIQPPVVVDVEGSLEAQRLQASATVSGLGYQSLAVRLEAGHRDGTVRIDRLELQEPGEGSALSASGMLNVGETLSAALEIDTPGLALPALREELSGYLRGDLAVEGRIGAAGWAVDLRSLDLSGEVNGMPASAAGKLALDSSRYLAGGQLRFKINGASGLLHELAGGRGTELEVAADDLGRWLPGLGGRLQAQARLRDDSRLLRVEARLEDVVGAGWQVRAATAEGELSLERPERFDAQVEARNVTRGGLHLTQVDLDLSGGTDRLEGQFGLRGDIQSSLTMVAERQGGRWRGQLQSSLIDTPLGPWQSPGDVNFDWDGARLALADHCWQGPAIGLCLSQVRLGREGQLELAVDGGLETFGPLLPGTVSLTGDLRAAVMARWTPDTALRATADLELGAGAVVQHLPRGERAAWGWESLQAQAQVEGGALALEGALRREGREVLSLTASLPAAAEGDLYGTLLLKRLQLAALQPLIPALSLLEGEVDGRLVLGGTLDQPLGRGRLTWAGGAIAARNSPTMLSDLTLQLDLQGDHWDIGGEGVLGGGPVRIGGELQPRSDWSLSLDVSGEHNRLFYPPSLELLVSPELEVTARTGRVHLSGRLQVEEGRVQQEALPEGSIELSRDVVMVDYAGNVIEGERDFETSMDLRVGIADRFRILGGGLDARVGGKLQLQQQPGRPLQVFGNLRVLGGEFRAYGQHLKIARGRVSFAGVPENPELDLRAERQVPLEKVTAGVKVTGSLEAPAIEVYTDPPMQQSEALSYLLRGRGLDSGSGTDGTALALSLGTGLFNRSAVVEGLNRVPGLSNIEFGAEGAEEDTAATVSGYIGERIYLSYGVGLYEPVNVLTARLYLQTRLWLEVVSRLESSVDLYYSFDLD